MKKQFIIAAVLACILHSTLIRGQQKENEIEALDEIVITATKFKTSKKNVGKVVYTINQQTLEKSQGRTLVDVLNDVPGIEINGNFSTRGQNLGYYIRGGRNRQVAILIDGVNVNDPSSFNGDFDLRQIDLNQIERIEILKGASSTLYGTGAATGVINIILKKADKTPFSGTVTSSLGTNTSSENQLISADERMINFNFNGTIGDFDYLLGLNRNRSSGLSAAESADPNIPFQEDIFKRQNALLKLNFKVNSNLKIGLLASIDDFSTDFDGFDFDMNTFQSIPADKENQMSSLQKRLGINADYSYNRGKLAIRTFLTDIERTENPSDDFFRGEVYGFDIFNHFKLDEQFSFLMGVMGQKQDMTQKTSYAVIEEGSGKQHFYDPYLSLNYTSNKGLTINLGGRLNQHSAYGSNWVYHFNPSYHFRLKNHSIKLFTSYSTAFIAPTLSEIFTKSDNLDALLPEETATFELGFETVFAKNLSMNATYFYREETNKIGYDPTTFQTLNDLGTFLARGLETEVKYRFSNKINVLANYTYIDRAKNLLLKIPQNTLFVRTNYALSSRTSSSLSFRYVDETEDFGGVPLKSYQLVDFFVNHQIGNNKITLFGSVTNLFNENYQEIAGFTTRGRNFTIGIRAQL